MAKLKYSSPLFNFCPIPLSTAGSGGGCARELPQAEYVCPVKDLFTGSVLFMETKNGCGRIPASETEANGSACYHVPMADFNIYNS